MEFTDITTRTLSMDSMDGCFLDFEDDCMSVTSTSSADAALKLLDESSCVVPCPHHIIDITLDSDDDEESVQIIRPLDIIDDDNVLNRRSTFSTDEELAKLQQLNQAVSFSQGKENMFLSQKINEHSIDDEIVNLMTGELIEAAELPSQTHETPAVGQEPEDHPVQRDVTVAPADTEIIDPIVCIMAYIHHTEPNQHVIVQAEGIVQSCRAHHQQGKPKFKNLSGAIFERLVNLFGGARFKEIYLNSQAFDPSAYLAAKVAQSHPAPDPPSSLQLAIAFGMHLGRTNPVRGETTVDLVRHGVTSLNAMSEKEMEMFWNFMTNHQG